MIQIPFTRETFSEEAKKRLSGINVSLEYDNIESALFQAAIRMHELLGAGTYTQIIKAYPLTAETAQPLAEALDYMQRIILHQAIYANLIFLIVRIGNDGITTKKNNDETTIFKYQQDELANTLINTAWFWAGKLTGMLSEQAATFPDWATSAQKKEMDSLPVNITDFRKWAGIDNLYFLIRARWIIREVWMDRVEARVKTTIPDDLREKISRALVYSVMETACIRLAYSDLPENIRKDIDNEQSKANRDKAETHIREQVAAQFAVKANRYWEDIDRHLRVGHTQASASPADGEPYSQTDKFAFL